MTVALLTFLAAATLIIVAPSPDSLLVTRNVFRRGQRGGFVTTAGMVTGRALWSQAAALGLRSAPRKARTRRRVAGAGVNSRRPIESSATAAASHSHVTASDI